MNRPGKSAHHEVACNFFNSIVGTPEKLMEFIKTAGLSNSELTKLLSHEAQKTFINLGALLEKEFTEKYRTVDEPCLEDGCAFEETDEICLNATLRLAKEYPKALIEVWARIFKRPENRIRVWKN